MEGKSPRPRSEQRSVCGGNLSRWAELKVWGDRGQVGWDRGVQVRLKRDLTNIGCGGASYWPGGLDQKRREDGENMCLWERPN